MTARRLFTQVLEAQDRLTILSDDEPIQVAKIYLGVDDAIAAIVVEECKQWYSTMVS